jgi:phage-related tail fiber protein
MTGTILTAIGKAKLASATSENQLEITHVAVGDWQWLISCFD